MAERIFRGEHQTIQISNPDIMETGATQAIEEELDNQNIVEEILTIPFLSPTFNEEEHTDNAGGTITLRNRLQPFIIPLVFRYPPHSLAAYFGRQNTRILVTKTAFREPLNNTETATLSSVQQLYAVGELRALNEPGVESGQQAQYTFEFRVRGVCRMRLDGFRYYHMDANTNAVYFGGVHEREGDGYPPLDRNTWGVDDQGDMPGQDDDYPDHIAYRPPATIPGTSTYPFGA